jgi:hypothetical protein
MEELVCVCPSRLRLIEDIFVEAEKDQNKDHHMRFIMNCQVTPFLFLCCFQEFSLIQPLCM